MAGSYNEWYRKGYLDGFAQRTSGSHLVPEEYEDSYQDGYEDGAFKAKADEDDGPESMKDLMRF
jgi:hypothetical protein